MKNFLLFALLCVCTNHSIAQFEWEALDPHNAQELEIIFASDEGELIGFMQNPYKFMISEDLGATWSDMFNGALSDGVTYSDPIVKKHMGFFYMASGEKLYKYDSSTVNFAEVLSLEDDVIDFAFLPNGNMVLCFRNALNLFDADFNLIVDFVYSCNKLYIGEDDEHYFISNNTRLNRFNSDLSSVQIIGDIPFSFVSELKFHNGVFNSESSYSLDGIIWNDYKFEGSPLSGSIHVNISGILFLFKNNVLYTSTTKGQTFVKRADVPLDFWRPDLIYSVNKLDVDADTLRHEVFIWDYSYCGDVLCISSKNGIDNWTKPNLPKGNPYASKIEAASPSNILLTTCNQYNFRKTFGSDGWTEFDTEDLYSQCGNLYNLHSFLDGTIVSNTLCVSTNQGIDWEASTDQYVGSERPLLCKNDVLYLLDYNESYKSLDQGNTWEEEGLNLFLYDETYTISATEHIFHYDIFDNIILKSDLKGNWVSSKELDDKYIIDIETSYNGKTIFILVEDFSEGLTLMVSYDDGETYEEVMLDIPFVSNSPWINNLETDRFGNLYIISDQVLYVSQDDGVSWLDIAPDLPGLKSINDIDFGHDGYLYLATEGTPILKSKLPIERPNYLQIFVYNDADGSCSYSQDEALLSGQNVKIGDLYSKYTNQNGEILFPILKGDYDIYADFRSDLYASCDNEHSVSFTGEEETQTIYIPLVLLNECADLTLGASVPFLRRCFENTLFIEVANTGSVPSENTQLKIVMDEFFDYVSSDMELISNTGDTYIFDVKDVSVGQPTNGKINFVISCDAELGAAHYFQAELLYDNPCDLIEGVSRTFNCQENIGSYDPNDMIGYINGIANKDIFVNEDTLEYLIRFQNTGTDTAFNIRIEDYIGEEFDQSSLHPISASHDYSWSIDRDILIVNFNDVLLVDSLTNEEDSHGFIKFRIGLKELTLDPGDAVDNVAEIYFDFNDPIITNTVDIFYLCKDVESYVDITICEGEEYDGYTNSGTYSDLLITDLMCDSIRYLNLVVLDESDPACVVSLINEVELMNVKVHPVPSHDILNVDTHGTLIAHYEVINQFGQSIMQFHELSKNQIDISNLPSGLYYLRSTSQRGTIDLKKFVKVD